MKRNELISMTISVLQASNAGLQAQDKVRAAKKAARESADQVINYFGDDLIGLVSFLNDAYQMLRAEQAFGAPDVKTESGAAIWKYRAQNWARYFHRSFANAHPDLKLSGMSPFKISEAKIKAKKTPMEIVLETVSETIGMDVVLRDDLDKAITRFQTRNRKRRKAAEAAVQAELDRVKAARKRAALEQAATVLQAAGLTAEEVESRLQEIAAR